MKDLSKKLSNRYSYLKLYRLFLIGLGIVYTIYQLNILDKIQNSNDFPISIIIIIIIVWYMIFNQIVMINFLFALDRVKVNNENIWIK